jgi:hypothetical protein
MQIGPLETHCLAVCETIARPNNYRFYLHRSHLLGDQIRDLPRTLKDCWYREYRCSQRECHRPSVKVPDPSRQRNRVPMQRYPCNGIIKLVFRSDHDERDGRDLHPECPLHTGAILVEFHHSEDHPGRENVAIPDTFKRWIMDSFHISPRDTFRALRQLIDQGAFRDIPAHLITPYNTTYWWTVALETRIGSKGDPWLNVMDYLMRNPDVLILS